MMHVLSELFVTMWPWGTVLLLPPSLVLTVFGQIFREVATLPLWLANVFSAVIPTLGGLMLIVAAAAALRVAFSLPKVPVRWYAASVGILFAFLYWYISFESSSSYTGFFPVLFVVLMMFGVGSFVFWPIWLVSQFLMKRYTLSKRHLKMLEWLLVGAFLYVVIGISWVLVELFVRPVPEGFAGDFFVINAAVKNTCYIDPQRENCPQTLTEISYIEPARFREMMAKAQQVKYEYRPEANQFTLVVRYSPTKAAIFDWRLVDVIGIDFQEKDVTVLGKDRLSDPPPFSGPWELDEWRY